MGDWLKNWPTSIYATELTEFSRKKSLSFQ